MTLPRPGARHDILLARRNIKMARSPHAYVRGNTAQYYEWLDAVPDHVLPEGPPIWICGDCHIGNLGPVASANGRVKMQIRDFDQTVIGNPAHDLIRLALSLATVARNSSLPGVVSVHMLEHMMGGYERALHRGAGPDLPKPLLVERLVAGAVQRSWRELARERIADERPGIPLGSNFWPLSKTERRAIEQLFAAPELQALVTRLKSRENDASVEVLDAAYWVKGCSSLGLNRYAVLVGVGGDEQCLIDVKEAVLAAAPRYADAVMPRDNAKRVAEGARRLAPALGKRMLATRLLQRGVFIRELRPQDLKLDIERFNIKQAERTAHYLAYVVGRAHARQMDRAGREAWRLELARDRSKSLDTPAWLWASVVQLLAAHEGAYLEHCRRHAPR
ncbi:DUF2252 family protein [Janthinobacterium sp.]|uniref:DUF2252 family protein n=1 Tax=Janthinobacterium sp. TaxID=1871054 RepID=UPI00293D3533|nr:DUF2252 family protein [Janthinobacterium sp.]